jgi:hypothetical protein
MRSVKILHCIKYPVLIIHQTVEHIACSAGARSRESRLELRRFSAQFRNFFSDRFGSEVLLSPFSETPDTLRKPGRSVGMINFPYLLAGISENLFASSASVSDFEKRTEKTENYYNSGEKFFPRLLSRLPSVGIDRFGTVNGTEFRSFFLKIPVTFVKSLCPGSFGKSCSQNTALRNGSGNIRSVSVQPRMFFISRKMGGKQNIHCFFRSDFPVALFSDLLIR